MASYLNGGIFQAFLEGKVDYASGGYVKAYVAGTAIPTDTYATVADATAGINPLPWPVYLDADGKGVIALRGATDIYVYDSDDNQIGEVLGLDAASDDIVDAYGNILVHFIGNEDAVVGISIENNVTSLPAIISAYGNDVNAGLRVTSKGSSPLNLDGGSTGEVRLAQNSTGPIVAYSDLNLNNNLSVTGLTTLTGNVTVTNALAVNGNTTINGQLVVNGANNLVPTGVIVDLAYNTVPAGFLACNGQAVSRTAYANLFAVLGIVWGAGNGSTTFNVPNFTRRTRVGVGGAATGVLGNAVGSVGGTETVTLTIAEMPNHAHSFGGPFASYVVNTGVDVTVYAAAQAGTYSTVSQGGSGAHNNVQPSAVVLPCIKT